MNARDFQSLASRLAAGAAPSELRTAIGRSYYAVFNTGAEHLRSVRFPVGKGAAAHGEVQKCLSASGDLAVAAVASELSDLHASRNRADYQLDRTDVENSPTVRAIVAQAGELIRVLDAAFKGPQRPQLHATMAAWRRANGYP